MTLGGSLMPLEDETYLKLIDFLKLFQIRYQSDSIFQSFQKFYLKLYHFGKISKEHIQLENGKKKM